MLLETLKINPRSCLLGLNQANQKAGTCEATHWKILRQGGVSGGDGGCGSRRGNKKQQNSRELSQKDRANWHRMWWVGGLD